MITSYLNILQDSLIKKIELLEQIEKKSLEQSEMIKGTNVDLELVGLVLTNLLTGGVNFRGLLDVEREFDIIRCTAEMIIYYTKELPNG